MRRIIILSLLFASMIFMKCECFKKNPTNNEDKTIDDYLNDGWQKFSAGDYSGAESAFNEALQLQSTDVSGNVGKGWSMLMQHSQELSSISTYLTKGVSNSTWDSDSRCGLSVAKLIQKQYADAITTVDLILAGDETYYFQYKPSIDYHDLLVIKAQAQYLSKKYANAWTTVQQLSSEYSLDSQDSSTWIVNGTNYFSFEAALAKVIEILSNTYRE